MLPGELAKHARSEGAKALTNSKDTGEAQPLRKASRLVFHPEATAAVAHAVRNVTLTKQASTRLAATLEYMAAERQFF